MTQETRKCKYPNCYSCEFDYCIKDSEKTQNKVPNRRDRRDYYKEYYRRKKEGKKVKKTTKTQYIRYVAVRNTLLKLKKQIGEVNYGIVMDAIEQIERE